MMGKLFKWRVDKIYIYPYGGCTKFNIDINTKIKDEFFVLISGPLIQIIFFMFFKRFLNCNDYLIFSKYNYVILFFNMLPIYPLDGGRLLNLLLKKVFPFKKSLKLSIYLSYVIIFFLLIFSISLTFYIVIVFLIIRIIEEQKKITIYYNKFLLERYLYNYRFKRIKIIGNIDNFYFEKKHVIKYKKMYITEKKCLKEYFDV